MTPDIIKQAAFVAGRIIHAGTGKPIAGGIRITASEGLVIAKVLEDGAFAISGDLALLFPNLVAQSYQLNFTIRADSAQYRTGFIEHPFVVTIPSGSSFDPEPPPDPPLPDPLINVGTIALPADPINIRGRVVEAKNPDTPISFATVEVLHSGPPIPSVTTNADGRYHFDEIIVTAPAQIQCSEPTNFKPATRSLVLDFGKLVNEENFRLAPL